MGRFQQPIHQPDVGIWFPVIHKGLDLLKGRWEAEQINMHAAHPRGAVHFRGEAQAIFLQLMQHKGVHRLIDQILRFHRGHGRRDHGLESPVILGAAVQIHRGRHRLLGPGQSLANPFGNGFDAGSVEFGSILGHGLDLSGLIVADGVDEFAGFHISRSHHQSIITPLENQLPCIQTQSVVLLFGGMAGITMLSQHRTDLAFKKSGLFGGDGFCMDERGTCHREESCDWRG